MLRIALMLLFVGFTSLPAAAQSPFSGQGIQNVPFSGSTPSSPTTSGKSGWSVPFSGGKPMDAPVESKPKSWMPWANKNKNSANQAGGMFSERPSWLPSPNTDQEPDILDRAMKKESKSMWARTNENMQEWAQKTGDSFREANQRMKESTKNTWENLTSKLPPPPWSNGGKKDGGSTKPPMRSASDWINQPKDRM